MNRARWATGVLLLGMGWGGSVLADLMAPLQGMPLSIFGNDDRIAVSVSEPPFRRLVRLTIQRLHAPSGTCTGALVGPNLVLTAAHCFHHRDPSAAIGVELGREGSERFLVTEALGAPETGVAPEFAESHPGHWGDWAVLRLRADFGEVVGWFEVEESFTARTEGVAVSVVLAGYRGDRQPRLAAHLGCHIRRVDADGTFGHDCDMVSGASGAPLLSCTALTDCRIVGVNISEFYNALTGDRFSGGYADSVANRGVQVGQFAPAVARLRHEWPHGNVHPGSFRFD